MKLIVIGLVALAILMIVSCGPVRKTSYITSDGIKCKRGYEYHCGYDLYDCSDGIQRVCATNVMMIRE